MTDLTGICKNVYIGRFRRIHMPTKHTFEMICLHLLVLRHSSIEG